MQAKGGITEYRLVRGQPSTGKSADENLATSMKGYLEQGWHPIGGVATQKDELVQAIVR